MTGFDEWSGPSDPGFAQEVAAYPGAEKVQACLQCGVCSGSCPMADHMQETPRRVMAYIIAGDRERALKSDTIWYCASCYACAVRCSAGISVTDVMAALRSLAAPSVQNISTAFYNAFAKSVIEGGRTHEAGAAMAAGLASGIPAMLRLAPVGFGLLRKGRISLRRHRIAGAVEVQALAKAVRTRRSAATPGEGRNAAS